MIDLLARAANVTIGVARAATLLDGATPHRVAWRSGPIRLLQYEPARRSLAGAAPADEATDGLPAAVAPLLIVPPIINRFRVVDLEPGRSLVESLVSRGIPVWLIDWGAPARIDGSTDFEDYILRFLPRAMDAVVGRTGRADLLGYCLGGTLATLFAARFPARVRRLVTVHAPIDFAAMDLLRTWTDARWFPVERLTAAFGNMPAALVQQGFLWLRPAAQATKLAKAWARADDASWTDSFAALEAWNADGVDVPGAAYRRLIVDLYRSNRLAAGTFRLGGTAVDLRTIDCALLVVAAQGDTICPPASARALLDLVSSRERRYLEVSGGHVGSMVGPRAGEALHGPVAEWLLA